MLKDTTLKPVTLLEVSMNKLSILQPWSDGNTHNYRRWFLPLLPLIFALFGCGGSLTGSPVPVEMTGRWQAILTDVPAYYGGYIPVFGADSSAGFFFYFLPDGRYQFDLNTLRTGNCFRSSSWSEWGTLSIADSDVTFIPARATYVLTDRCGKNQYLDRAPAKTFTLTITPTQDKAGWPYLHLVLPNGEELYLEKCRTCK